MSDRRSLNILFVDDNRHALDSYCAQMARSSGHTVTPVTDAKAALELAVRRLFDLVVIDAKMNYQSEAMGGVLLANELRPRYGSGSLVVVSQYVTQQYIAAHGQAHLFLEKGDSVKAFVARLCREGERLRDEQTVFVAMPFDQEYLPTYKKAIEPAVLGAGFVPVRLDHVAYTGSIHTKMFDSIRDAKAVVFVADGANPNVYYEAGYAHALRKEMVTVASDVTKLPFDIRDRKALAHSGDLKKLKKELAAELAGILAPPDAARPA